MSRKFQCKVVPISWIEHESRRLDCGPYMSGAMEARELINGLPCQKDDLSAVTKGIINAGRISRNWIDDPDYGYPFLSSTDILQMDLRFVNHISKKSADQNGNLLLENGSTLITRSGSIGKMAYARPEMAGKACTEDVLRVIPDANKIKPGYLYAYLNTSFGVPLIISGTYGSIITHLEPHHISELPIPRLNSIEDATHDLIERASALRVNANLQIEAATEKYLSYAGLEDISAKEWHQRSRKLGFTSSISRTSLRAMNYIPINQELEAMIKEQANDWKPLLELVEPGTLRSGPRFKRIDADPEYGVELLGQQECFNVRPNGRWISKKYLPTDNLIFMPEASTLMAAQGCAGEYDLFGRCQFISGKRTNYAYSQHFVRIIANEEKIPRGALFAFLNSHLALRIRKGYQVGSVQQDFHPKLLANMPIPLIDNAHGTEVDMLIKEAFAWFDQAIDLEDKATSLVENAIKEGGR